MDKNNPIPITASYYADSLRPAPRRVAQPDNSAAARYTRPAPTDASTSSHAAAPKPILLPHKAQEPDGSARSASSAAGSGTAYPHPSRATQSSSSAGKKHHGSSNSVDRQGKGHAAASGDAQGRFSPGSGGSRPSTGTSSVQQAMLRQGLGGSGRMSSHASNSSYSQLAAPSTLSEYTGALLAGHGGHRSVWTWQ